MSLILISGPTGVGKSAIGARVAEKIGGEVICADSRQMFKGIPVGSAQPDPADVHRAPHHLFEVLEPDEICSAGRYRELADPVIASVESRGKVPVLVGGTGFYLKAVVGGASLAPPAPPVLLDRLEIRYPPDATAKAWEALKAVDEPSTLRINPADRYRILRALAVFEHTGKPASSFGGAATPRPHLLIALTLQRSALVDRLNARCAEMLRSGMLEEAKALLLRSLPESAPVLTALGYRHLFRVIDGSLREAEALDQLRQDTRRYAKRQMTWLRSQPGVVFVDAADPERALEEVLELVRSGRTGA